MRISYDRTACAMFLILPLAHAAPWWAWLGWPAIAAIAQAAAAFGTLVALFVFFAQLQQARTQAREDRAHQQGQLHIMGEQLKFAKRREDRFSFMAGIGLGAFLGLIALGVREGRARKKSPR